MLVIGDAIVDRYLFGEVRRISQDAPVPVLTVNRDEETTGAAFNVVANLEAMDVPVIGVYGASWPTDPVIKMRLIGHGQNMVRVDFDTPQQPVTLAEIEPYLPSAKTVILSDYGMGALGNAREIIAHCKAAGKRVLVDPKGHKYERYHGADLLKPNEMEITDAIGHWDSEEELDGKIAILKERYAIGSVLMTRASRGLTLYNERKIHFDAVQTVVRDVTGAGDTAIAAYAAALYYGCDEEQATRYANKAAGIAVTRFGTVAITKGEVFEWTH